MISRARRAVSRLARALASFPLRCLPSGARAEVVSDLSEKMVATTSIPGGELRFYAPTPLLIARADTLLTKEPDTIRWIDDFEGGAVFWDIGANVGVFSLYAAVVCNSRVLSFEPAASNFFVLSRNVQINSLASRVTAFCLAFSERSNLGVLNLASPELGYALSQFGSAGETSRYLDRAAPGIMQGMIGFSLDEFVQQFEPVFPNYLKIDVDGLEWPILRGAVKTLSDPRLHSAMIELSVTNQAERNDAIKFLKERGLDLVSRGEVQSTANEKAANHLFERHS